MSGHSMGGATALKVGSSDPRIKIVLTFDPWLGPLNKDISNDKVTLGLANKKAVYLLNTSSFLDKNWGGCNYDFEPMDVHNHLKMRLGSRVEDVFLKGVEHMH